MARDEVHPRRRHRRRRRARRVRLGRFAVRVLRQPRRPTNRRLQRPSVAPTPDGSPATPRPSVPIPHDDPALEALLPDEVDGTKLVKLSVGPISTGSAGAQGMKDRHTDRRRRRVVPGWLTPGIPAAGSTCSPCIPGADSSELLTQFAQMTLAETVGGSVEQRTSAAGTSSTSSIRSARSATSGSSPRTTCCWGSRRGRRRRRRSCSRCLTPEGSGGS